MHNDIRYSEVSCGCNALLCETDEFLMLIIENERSAERRMRLNEFKPAFVRQSKQPFGIALPIVPEQPCLSVKIIAEAVIYVFKAGVRNGAYALLPVQSKAHKITCGGGKLHNESSDTHIIYCFQGNYTMRQYRWQCVKLNIRCKKVIFCTDWNNILLAFWVEYCYNK